MKPGLSRRLGAIARRLDLLGYSVGTLPARYADLVESMPDYYDEVPLSFEQFAAIMRAVDLSKACQSLEEGDYDLGEYISQYVFQYAEIRKLLPSGVTINRDVGTFFENFDPYFTLRLLALNPPTQTGLCSGAMRTLLTEDGQSAPKSLSRPTARQIRHGKRDCGPNAGV